MTCRPEGIIILPALRIAIGLLAVRRFTSTQSIVIGAYGPEGLKEGDLWGQTYTPI
jgi:hypothetical protein